LLPYHRVGQSKYEFLGRNYELADFETAPAEVVAKLRAIVDETFGRKGWSEVNNPLQPRDERLKCDAELAAFMLTFSSGPGFPELQNV
jgi:hypothetical protein